MPPPNFMPTTPHTFLNTQKYSEKTDAYSFGIMMWEVRSLTPHLSNTLAGTHPDVQQQMLTGKTPYTDESNIDVVIKVIKDGYRPTIPTGTPPAIASLMRACWAADPGDRPTFSEIIARLDKHLKTLK